jgi:ribulose-phosphate 3-epimerase
VSPGVSVDLGYPLECVRDAVLELSDRVVIMGTETGVKGVGLEPEALERVREVVRWRGLSGSPEIYVDGGIRRHTVPEIARAGADGVVPGSLVFGSESWEEAVRWVQSQDDPGATR